MKKETSVLLTLAFFVVTYGAMKIANMKFIHPESESVNGSLFLVQDKTIKNDYVVFEYDKEPYKIYQYGKLFIKRIACDSGQHLKVHNRQVLCDNRLIATGIDRNSEGIVLPHYQYDGVIPNDKFFAIGDSPRSYDSRYFGLVDKKQIRNTARRIF